MGTIGIIHNLPRVGGTIISKSISAQKDIALLSEIHPQGIKVRDMMKVDTNLGDPLYQAQNWYNLFKIDDYNELVKSQLNFLDKIKIINEKIKKQNKFLILRDWSFIDYLGKPFIEPTNKNILLELLRKDFEIKNIFLLRDPLETFLSCMKKLPFFSKNYSFDKFLDGYNSFLKDINNENVIHFENFAERPDEILNQISIIFNFKFNKDYKQKLKTTHITGDVAASQATEIYQSKKIASELLDIEQKKKISQNNKYNEILAKLNEF
tara:strand:+ start:213 stop:1010 length:798 start_codon:yes stop_codon:yes gene_type:complete